MPGGCAEKVAALILPTKKTGYFYFYHEVIQGVFQ